MIISIKSSLRFVLLVSSILLHSLLYNTKLYSQANMETNTEMKDDLARVAIVPFIDLSYSKNFAYMPGSLSDAIDTSMEEKFDYIRSPKEKINSIASKIFKKKRKPSIYRAKQIAVKGNSDIVILGYFTFSKKQKKLIIHTYIYFKETNKLQALKVIRNKVDSSILEATDKVSTVIVSKIAKYALQQEELLNKEKNKTTDKKKKTKTKLHKAKVTASWNKYKWNIVGMGTLQIPISSYSDIFYNAPKFSIALNKIIWKHYILGGKLISRFYNGNSEELNFTFDIFTIAISAGIKYDFFTKWRAYAIFNLGYYAAMYQASTNDNDELNQKNLYNPYYSIDLGIKYLLFKRIALGIGTNYSLIYDSPKPIMDIGFGFNATFLF